MINNFVNITITFVFFFTVIFYFIFDFFKFYLLIYFNLDLYFHLFYLFFPFLRGDGALRRRVAWDEPTFRNMLITF